MRADITLPAVIESNMVLQREQPVPIWGWASPGEQVSVTFGDQTKTGKAGDDGRWRVTLDAMKANAEGREMTIKGAGAAITLRDVLVGEVWLCSGQSNMEWNVSGALSGQKEISEADYPTMRLFQVPRVPAGEPQIDMAATWQKCSPQTVGSFSAVAYFFGRHLISELNVPIGLIHSSWGGTRIEPWTPKEGFALVENEELKKIGEKQFEVEGNFHKQSEASIETAEQWVARAKAAKAAGRPIPPLPNVFPGASAGNVSHLYNGMIAPLVPYGIRGAIWYQGESNVGQGMRYRDHMQALIEGWRQAWDQPTNRAFPFLFVQLAPFTYNAPPEKLPEMWEAQLATLALPNTGVALTMDIGDVKDIHPRNKQEVGKRLALWALAKTYGKEMLVYSGPMFKAMTVDGNKVLVTFDHIGGGLQSRDTKPLTWFEVAGKDGNFVHAKAEIGQLGESVTVWSELVDEPTAVRYGWNQAAEPNLMNAEGLPAAPFRSDRK